MSPEPASVPYNDWRQVAVEPLETFTPTLPVSVVIPCYQPPAEMLARTLAGPGRTAASATPAEMLARTLAGLESQTCPRDLFEVVIVDDGSDPPLARPRATPLDVRVVRRERRGYGPARARNTGARAAAHDVLLFLDGDMLVETNWIAAHARWHHAVSDALTIGLRAHVAADGIDPGTIRRRPGALEALLAGRRIDDTPGIEEHLAKTGDLSSRRADDPFTAVLGANFGIGKGFYELVGGCDESFVRWGLEDNELGYRAYVRGGLLIPVREARAWHQVRWAEDRDAKRRIAMIQRAKAAHLIAHARYRGRQPGRLFQVPRFVVTIDGRRGSADQVVRAVGGVLADRAHDLVVRIETGPGGDGERLARLREEFGPDPRVRVAPPGAALDEFPSSPFHVTLPARVFAGNPVHRLRAGLGDAVAASAILPDGARVSITRAWALHRARRTGKSPADFGEVRTIPARVLHQPAWSFLKRVSRAAWRKAAQWRAFEK